MFKVESRLPTCQQNPGDKEWLRLHILKSLGDIYPAVEDRLEFFPHYHVDRDEELRAWEARLVSLMSGSHIFVDVESNLFGAVCGVRVVCWLSNTKCKLKAFCKVNCG